MVITAAFHAASEASAEAAASVHAC